MGAEYSPEFPTGEWDEEVTLEVTVRVKVRPGSFHEPDKDYSRTPASLAATAVYVGREDPSNLDGYADLVGSVVIVDVTEL